MCWITLSPKKRKHHHHHHPHMHNPFHHHHHHNDSSSSIHLIRRDRISFDAPVPTTLHSSHHHHNKIRIIEPIVEIRPDHHHHRHHHHLHPLHMHPPPIKLHGPGRKRAPAPTPRPPPPSRCSSPPRSHSRDPTYRIQPISESRPYRTVIATPGVDEVRETTRIALREAKPERNRLRRVAGYEVLGREVPWSWDCVSSVGSSKGGRKFPPFGGARTWM